MDEQRLKQLSATCEASGFPPRVARILAERVGAVAPMDLGTCADKLIRGLLAEGFDLPPQATIPGLACRLAAALLEPPLPPLAECGRCGEAIPLVAEDLCEACAAKVPEQPAEQPAEQPLDCMWALRDLHRRVLALELLRQMDDLEQRLLALEARRQSQPAARGTAASEPGPRAEP